MHFISESVGWACGKNGIILRTIDGGQTWKEIESSTKSYLYKVSFVDDNFGWILGKANDNGEDIEGYLSTKDGGQNWAKVSLPDNRDFSSLYFTSSIHGCGIASRSEILCTVDGKNWSVVKLADEARGEILFTDEKNGWLVGAAILKTTNGGRTWTYSLKHIDRETRKYQGLNLDEISFADKQTGWALGSTKVYKTYNGGVTWELISNKWLSTLQSSMQIQKR